MELEVIEKKETRRYIVTRDDFQIEFECEQLTAGLKEPNDLCRFMREIAGFPLETLQEVTECIAKGPTQVVRERTIANTDEKALKKIYGFTQDRQALLNLVPVSHINNLDKAERMAEYLRGQSLEDYNFDGGKFSVKPEAIKRITKSHTKYATPRQAELHRRIDAIKDQIDSIRDEYGFDPIIIEEYNSPENLYEVLHRVVKNSAGISAAV